MDGAMADCTNTIPLDNSMNEYLRNIFSTVPSRRQSQELYAGAALAVANPVHEVNKILVREEESLPPTKRRRKQVPVPIEKKNEAYYRYRKKNTQTARSFRRKQKEAKISRQQKLDASREQHDELMKACASLQIERDMLQQKLQDKNLAVLQVANSEWLTGGPY